MCVEPRASTQACSAAVAPEEEELKRRKRETSPNLSRVRIGARVLDYKDDRTLSRFLTDVQDLAEPVVGMSRATSGSSRPRSSARGSWRCSYIKGHTA